MYKQKNLLVVTTQLPTLAWNLSFSNLQPWGLLLSASLEVESGVARALVDFICETQAGPVKHQLREDPGHMWSWVVGFKYFLFSPLPGEMIQFD